MIIGTAGHIDHGKTTLVRALTGVDTDRLPEEKKRGITIELGYAFLKVPELAERIAFIDVPGHERLVHTMLAGATGIDYALLLVAADDGVMPQTCEHLAVLSLLGLARGAVVLTKCARVEPTRVRAVADEARALLQGTPLAEAPLFETDAHTNQGIGALRAALLTEATVGVRRNNAAAAFRLAVDRAFTLDGVGTVVTGTVHAGRVSVGDELVLAPGGQHARVRSLHAQNQAVSEGAAGQRCAVALAGVDKDAIQRGQWLVAPQVQLATERLDASMTLWHAEAHPLRSGTPVHVHIGSASVLGTVALLDDEVLAPGDHARVQLVLRVPVGAWHGDRVVLRDASASRTLAGGRVLDPFAPKRYRRTAQRLCELDALALDTPAARMEALLAAAPHGLDLHKVAHAQAAALPAISEDALRHTDAHSVWALHARHVQQAGARVQQVLTAFHDSHPEELGPDTARLRRLALPRLPQALWRRLLEHLQLAQQVQVRGAFAYRPEHGVRLSATDERLAQKVAAALAEAGIEGAWVRDLARHSAEPEPLMRVTLARLAQRGELHQVVKDLYYPPATLERLVTVVRQLAAAHAGEVLAADFRDATRLGRKRAIQVLEYLGRVGLLRRVGNLHRLRTDCNLYLDEGPT